MDVDVNWCEIIPAGVVGQLTVIYNRGHADIEIQQGTHIVRAGSALIFRHTGNIAIFARALPVGGDASFDHADVTYWAKTTGDVIEFAVTASRPFRFFVTNAGGGEGFTVAARVRGGRIRFSPSGPTLAPQYPPHPSFGLTANPSVEVVLDQSNYDIAFGSLVID